MLAHSSRVCVFQSANSDTFHPVQFLPFYAQHIKHTHIWARAKLSAYSSEPRKEIETSTACPYGIWIFKCKCGFSTFTPQRESIHVPSGKVRKWEARLGEELQMAPSPLPVPLLSHPGHSHSYPSPGHAQPPAQSSALDSHTELYMKSVTGLVLSHGIGLFAQEQGWLWA